MRFLTQEQLVRKTVIEGLGRALRQVYTEEQVGPPTEYSVALARFIALALSCRMARSLNANLAWKAPGALKASGLLGGYASSTSTGMD